jgi:hypothetical protein
MEVGTMVIGNRQLIHITAVRSAEAAAVLVLTIVTPLIMQVQVAMAQLELFGREKQELFHQQTQRM